MATHSLDTNDDEIAPATSLPMRPVPADALRFEQSGDFWGLLASLELSLVLSRERENFLMLLAGVDGRPWQSTMLVAQPTGLYHDPAGRRLLVGTTRTPNQVIQFSAWRPGEADATLRPADVALPEDATVFLPRLCHFLPGTLYTHDVVLIDDAIHLIATDHNFVARVEPDGGWTRVWWPQVLEAQAPDQFRINRMQLNSIAVNTSVDDSYYTAFSDEVDGPKPWRRGFGPDKRGVVLDGASRHTILRGLTCPHSVRLRDRTLWLCNSGYGELGFARLQPDGAAGAWQPVATLPGFVRGLCFAGTIAFVGLSKVLEHYETYAPGVHPRDSRCGISAIDTRTGAEIAALWWPHGHEIYDIQTLPGILRPLFPEVTNDKEAAGHAVLRFMG